MAGEYNNYRVIIVHRDLTVDNDFRFSPYSYPNSLQALLDVCYDDLVNKYIPLELFSNEKGQLVGNYLEKAAEYFAERVREIAATISRGLSNNDPNFLKPTITILDPMFHGLDAEGPNSNKLYAYHKLNSAELKNFKIEIVKANIRNISVNTASSDSLSGATIEIIDPSEIFLVRTENKIANLFRQWPGHFEYGKEPGEYLFGKYNAMGKELLDSISSNVYNRDELVKEYYSYWSATICRTSLGPYFSGTEVKLTPGQLSPSFRFPPQSLVFIDFYNHVKDKWVRIFVGIIASQTYSYSHLRQISYTIQAESLSSYIKNIKIMGSTLSGILQFLKYRNNLASNEGYIRIVPIMGAIVSALTLAQFVWTYDATLSSISEFRGFNFTQNAGLGAVLDTIARVANVSSGSVFIGEEDLAVLYLKAFRLLYSNQLLDAQDDEGIEAEAALRVYSGLAPKIPSLLSSLANDEVDKIILLCGVDNSDDLVFLVLKNDIVTRDFKGLVDEINTKIKEMKEQYQRDINKYKSLPSPDDVTIAAIERLENEFKEKIQQIYERVDVKTRLAQAYALINSFFLIYLRGLVRLYNYLVYHYSPLAFMAKFNGLFTTLDGFRNEKRRSFYFGEAYERLEKEGISAMFNYLVQMYNESEENKIGIAFRARKDLGMSRKEVNNIFNEVKSYLDSLFEEGVKTVCNYSSVWELLNGNEVSSPYPSVWRKALSNYHFFLVDESVFYFVASVLDLSYQFMLENSGNEFGELFAQFFGKEDQRRYTIRISELNLETEVMLPSTFLSFSPKLFNKLNRFIFSASMNIKSNISDMDGLAAKEVINNISSAIRCFFFDIPFGAVFFTYPKVGGLKEYTLGAKDRKYIFNNKVQIVRLSPEELLSEASSLYTYSVNEKNTPTGNEIYITRNIVYLPIHLFYGAATYSFKQASAFSVSGVRGPSSVDYVERLQDKEIFLDSFLLDPASFFQNNHLTISDANLNFPLSLLMLFLKPIRSCKYSLDEVDGKKAVKFYFTTTNSTETYYLAPESFVFLYPLIADIVEGAEATKGVDIAKSGISFHFLTRWLLSKMFIENTNQLSHSITVNVLNPYWLYLVGQGVFVPYKEQVGTIKSIALSFGVGGVPSLTFNIENAVPVAYLPTTPSLMVWDILPLYGSITVKAYRKSTPAIVYEEMRIDEYYREYLVKEFLKLYIRNIASSILREFRKLNGYARGEGSAENEAVFYLDYDYMLIEMEYEKNSSTAGDLAKEQGIEVSRPDLPIHIMKLKRLTIRFYYDFSESGRKNFLESLAAAKFPEKAGSGDNTSLLVLSLKASTLGEDFARVNGVENTYYRLYQMNIVTSKLEEVRSLPIQSEEIYLAWVVSVDLTQPPDKIPVQSNTSPLWNEIKSFLSPPSYWMPTEEAEQKKHKYESGNNVWGRLGLLVVPASSGSEELYDHKVLRYFPIDYYSYNSISSWEGYPPFFVWLAIFEFAITVVGIEILKPITSVAYKDLPVGFYSVAKIVAPTYFNPVDVVMGWAKSKYFRISKETEQLIRTAEIAGLVQFIRSNGYRVMSILEQEEKHDLFLIYRNPSGKELITEAMRTLDPFNFTLWLIYPENIVPADMPPYYSPDMYVPFSKLMDLRFLGVLMAGTTVPRLSEYITVKVPAYQEEYTLETRSGQDIVRITPYLFKAFIDKAQEILSQIYGEQYVIVQTSFVRTIREQAEIRAKRPDAAIVSPHIFGLAMDFQIKKEVQVGGRTVRENVTKQEIYEKAISVLQDIVINDPDLRITDAQALASEFVAGQNCRYYFKSYADKSGIYYAHLDFAPYFVKKYSAEWETKWELLDPELPNLFVSEIKTVYREVRNKLSKLTDEKPPSIKESEAAQYALEVLNKWKKAGRLEVE